MLAGIGIKLSGAFCASANTASEYITSTTNIVRINWLPMEGIGQDSGTGRGVQMGIRNELVPAPRHWRGQPWQIAD